jgi:hypothetical protein
VGEWKPGPVWRGDGGGRVYMMRIAEVGLSFERQEELQEKGLLFRDATVYVGLSPEMGFWEPRDGIMANRRDRRDERFGNAKAHFAPKDPQTPSFGRLLTHVLHIPSVSPVRHPDLPRCQASCHHHHHHRRSRRRCHHRRDQAIRPRPTRLRRSQGRRQDRRQPRGSVQAG